MKIVVPIPRPTFERAEASGRNLDAIYPRILMSEILPDLVI